MTTTHHYNRHRYYSPGIGRYISADPLGQVAEIHPYRYAFNNPLIWYDPFGLNNFGGPVFQSNNPSGPVFVPAGPLSAPGQVSGAIDDFVANYRAMIAAATPGADKYFHCKANCQASARGSSGQAAARAISALREGSDLLRADFLKNPPPSLLNAMACFQDATANQAGRNAGSRIAASSQSPGSSGNQCSSKCARFRPSGLPAQY